MNAPSTKHNIARRGAEIGCDALGWCSREDCRDADEEDRRYADFLRGRGLNVLKVEGGRAHLGPQGGTTAYDELLAKGHPLDSHESDMYVKDSPGAREVLRRHGSGFSKFVSNVDGEDWLDVPFGWAPFWRERGKS